MALARGRRRHQQDYWPGFVDVLSTLLLVVTFLMSMFMIAQYFASQESSGKDTALSRLNKQISSLTDLLALERSKKRRPRMSLPLFPSRSARRRKRRTVSLACSARRVTKPARRTSASSR